MNAQRDFITEKKDNYLKQLKESLGEKKERNEIRIEMEWKIQLLKKLEGKKIPLVVQGESVKESSLYWTRRDPYKQGRIK